MFNSDLKGSDILLTGVVAGFRLLLVRSGKAWSSICKKKKREKERRKEKERGEGREKKSSPIPGAHLFALSYTI